MTIDHTRDPLGRLPIVPTGVVACGKACSVLPEAVCQGSPAHPGRCRWYAENGGGFVEWFPREPYPVVVVGRL